MAWSTPRIVGAVAILIIGWLIARAVKWGLVKALKAVPFDDFARKLKVSDFLQKGEVRYQLSELIGITAYWVILLAFLLAGLDALGMTVAAQLLEKVLDYVPQVLAGVIVLLLGLFFATLVGGIVQTAAANAGVAQAKGLSQIARVAVIIFSVAVALEKFFSSMIIQTTFTIVLTAICFGFALAFGLGCKDIAGRSVSDFLDKIRGGR
ncbi:MAG: hypothetical protein HYZ88_00570 [Candidatus Omnitrophica bacterium]|nr:hypothetical protein [Candidatus Omnitrophota bacterium]